MSVGMSGYSGVGVTHMTGQILRFRRGVVAPPPEWTTPPPPTTTLSPTTTAAPTTTATPTTLPPTTTAAPTTPPPTTTASPTTPPASTTDAASTTLYNTTTPDPATTSGPTTTADATTTPGPTTTDASTTDAVTTTPDGTTSAPTTTLQPGTTDTTGGGQYDCCWQQAWDGPYATQEGAQARLESGARFYRPCLQEPAATSAPTTTSGCAQCSGESPSKVWVEIGGVTGDCARANGNWECEGDGCEFSAQTSDGAVTVEFMPGGVAVTYAYTLGSGTIYWLNAAQAPHDCCAESQVGFNYDSGDCQGAGGDSTCIIRPQCGGTSTDEPQSTTPPASRCAENSSGCEYSPISIVQAGGQWYVVGVLTSEACCDPDVRTSWGGPCESSAADCCSSGFDRNVSSWKTLEDAEAYGRCNPVVVYPCNEYPPTGEGCTGDGCVYRFSGAVDLREELSTTFGPETPWIYARYLLMCENCDRSTTTTSGPTTTSSVLSTGAGPCGWCADEAAGLATLAISGVTCYDGDANGEFTLSGVLDCVLAYNNPWGVWTLEYGDGYLEAHWLSASRNGGVVWRLDLSSPYLCCLPRNLPFLSDWGSCEGTGGGSTCSITPACS